jgi:hypothetical protein
MADPRDAAEDRDDDEAPKGAAKTKKAIESKLKELDRADELSTRAGVRKALLDQMKDVEKGFEDQIGRSNSQMDYWDLYNCKLSEKQFYNGNSQIFVPIIANAIEARRTRFVNQMFPQNKRHVEVISGDESPNAIVALVEKYIRGAKLRSQVIPAMIVNGDVEGQYNLYVSWKETQRHVVFKTRKKAEVDGMLPDDAEEIEDIEEQTIKRGQPHVEVLSDADVLILPTTADGVNDALDVGGTVTVLRRWSKAKIKKLIKDEEIDKKEGQTLLSAMSSGKDVDKYPDKEKAMVDAAGIRGGKGQKTVTVYETWSMLTIEGERRLCRTFYAGDKNILSCKRNPNWNDKCPVISARVSPVAGSVKGKSLLEKCESMQLQANDAVNEGMDSAAYALMPIIMTNPEKNPRVGSMILNLAAIWETSPQDTQFAQFPQLWTEAFNIVAACKNEIFQTLSVTPAMMPGSTGGKSKRNQAEMATEQQIDILNTADVVTNIEEQILSPLVNWFIELDHQHRDEETTARAYGEMGLEAKMERVPPIQMDARFEFIWSGVEAAKNAQQIQQQIAGMNVLRGIPPQQYPDYTLDVTPAIRNMVESLFGPRIGPKIFKSKLKQFTMQAEKENDLLADGIDLPVHPMDEDPAHMEAHQKAMKETGDPYGTIRAHIQKHVTQQNMKIGAQIEAQSKQQGGQGMPGMPGGAGPGVAGTPRPGAQPMPPRGGQNPPGAIHQDQMQDPTMMPRKVG